MPRGIDQFTRGEAHGKEAVLAMTRDIFASAASIEGRPVHLSCSGQTAAAELEIWVDGKLALHVVDVIDFDAAGLITAVRAYRSN